MAKSLTGRSTITSSWKFEKTDDLELEGSYAQSYSVDQQFAAGTDAEELDVLWTDRREVTSATGTDDIDLSGALTDFFGDSVAFVKVREILIKNRATAAGDDLLVGGAGSQTFSALFNGNQSAELTVRAGGWISVGAPLDGYSVVAGSEDILRVQHDGTNDIEFDIIIKGTSA